MNLPVRNRSEGYELVNSYANSDVVIVNTCGFIDSAVQESLDEIGNAMNENGKVIVTGCLGAKADLIKEHYPNVLSVTGPQAYEDVVSAVHAVAPPNQDPFVSLIPPGGIKLTPRHYAYLKISEGCNHHCKFCIIPSMRGKLVSRPIDEVLTEAQNLVKAGVKELLIVSQDTSAYGVDRKFDLRFWNGRPVRTKFQDLCKELGKMDAWVRLHYVYPYPHVDEIIELMSENNLLPYLDIPFQHGSPKILKSMSRPAASENTLKRIETWRGVCPDLTIRSTFIVGFPGETDEDFELCLDFLRQAQLDLVGCFAYSDVEGAKANDLPDHVPEELKQERLERFMEVQTEISQLKLQQKLGKEITVLVDEVSDNHAIARSSSDAPEVDGIVYVYEGQNLKVGDFAKVRVVDSDEHDLFAELIN